MGCLPLVNLHHFCLTKEFPNNSRLQPRLANWNVIWLYFASIRLCLDLLFITRTIQTRSELYRLSLGSIVITLSFSVLCNLDLLPADQLSVYLRFFLSLLKGRMISKEINQGLYKVGREFPFKTLIDVLNITNSDI